MRQAAQNPIAAMVPIAHAMGLFLVWAHFAHGQPIPPAGATGPATGEAPASRPEDSNALRLLQDLEAVGQKYASLEANVWFHLYKRLEDDEELRTGRVVIARGGGSAPDRLYIGFETLRQGQGATLKEKVEYALDGQWLTVAKEKIKTLTRYQVAAPGQKVELFRLGQGPFPMPFGQKAAEVLEHFEATTRPPAQGDPSGTDYLRLITRPAYRDELGFLELEMWMDSNSHLPVRLVTQDKNKVTRTVAFSGVRPAERVNEKQFLIQSKPGWQLNIEPLKKE